MNIKLSIINCLLFIVLAAGQIQSSVAGDAGGGIPVKIGDYDVFVHGLAQFDYSNYDGALNREAMGESGSDLYFRTVHLGFDGAVSDDWSFSFEYEFDHNEIEVATISYLGFGHNLNLTVGRFDVPFSFDFLNSEASIPALEPNAASNLFSFGASDGILLSGFGNNYSWTAAIMREELGANNELDLLTVGRVTYAPLGNSGNGTVLHLGLGWARSTDVRRDAFQLVSPETPEAAAVYRAEYRLSGHNEVHRAAELQSAPIAYDESDRISYELAGTFNSFYFQAEYYDSSFDGVRDPAGVSHGADFDGYSVLIAWTLTGETRPYDSSTGLFGEITPACKLRGAWEVFVRYTEIDLNNTDTPSSVRGADADMYTLGISWYVNENIRMGLNYTDYQDSNLPSIINDGQGITARLQYHF